MDLPVVVHNERTKLSATWLNGVSLTIFGVGGFGPWIAWLNAPAAHPDVLFLGIASLVCFSIAGGLHLAARSFLKRIIP